MAILTFLGTGTSMGVPMIGCDCRVCKSTNPKDKRSRSSVMITEGGKNILVDTTTDFYYQAINNGLRNINAVLYTHAHADHVNGIDELRRFNHIQHEEIVCYGRADTIDAIRRIFSYIFDRKEGQFDLPQLDTRVIDSTLNLFGVEITPIELLHGTQLIYGYKFYGCAYLTDCSAIPDSSMEQLYGLDTIIIDALRYAPHKNHFNFDEALAMIANLNPKRAFLTHLTHDYLYDEMKDKLPENVYLPYDGLKIEL